MKPTIILSYNPKKIRDERASGSGNGGKVNHYLTDVGWLSVPEMSKRTGINEFSLRTRMDSLEPGDKRMFNPGHILAIGHATPEWQGLSGAPRTENLLKVPMPTQWEAKL